jgi:hypothetical protein
MSTSSKNQIRRGVLDLDQRAGTALGNQGLMLRASSSNPMLAGMSSTSRMLPVFSTAEVQSDGRSASIFPHLLGATYFP